MVNLSSKHPSAVERHRPRDASFWQGCVEGKGEAKEQSRAHWFGKEKGGTAEKQFRLVYVSLVSLPCFFS